MRQYLLLILFLCVLPIIYAADPAFYFKEGSSAVIKTPCKNNGVLCNVSTECNITINYPNLTTLISNQQMSYSTPYYIYTTSILNKTGEYPTLVYCCEGNDCNSALFSFMVNSNGSETNNDVMPLLIFFIFMIIVSLVFTIWFWSMKHALRYFFILLTFIFITLLCYFGYKSTQYISIGIERIMFSVYIVSLIITIMMFLIVLVDITIKLLQIWVTRKDRSFREQF